jgi:mycothiol synthase
MVDVLVRRPVAPSDVDVLRRLADDAGGAAGHPMVGDTVWRDLADPSPDTAIIVAREGETTVGAMHIGPSDSLSTPHATLSFAVAPGAPDAEVVAALTTTALADRRSHGGGHIELWVLGADPSWDDRAHRLGLDLARELRQLRVPLPVPEPEPVTWPSGVTVRHFEPGRDEAAWVAVNNRAFARDPDQGGWVQATLRRREQEEWFDAAGFLLAEDDRGLAGFCWTKVHPAAPPVEPVALGEIYVIGVDPGRQGSGLGRSLMLAGLADLHDRRGAPVGMLFVDATNDAALRLYESIGFSVARVDRAYACEL